MYRDDWLVFCAKVTGLGEGVCLERASGVRCDGVGRQRALLLGHSDTDDWRCWNPPVLLCTDYSRALPVLPVHTARSCPREYITIRPSPPSTR